MKSKFYKSFHVESKGFHPETGEPYTIFVISRPDTSRRMKCGNVYECYLSRPDYPLEYMFGIPEKEGLHLTLAIAHDKLEDYWKED